MIRTARFLGGLLLVFALQVFAERVAPRAGTVVDLFVVVMVLNALDGNLVAGMLGGLAAGVAADSLGGAVYGLHGFAGTATGFLAAVVARQLVVQQLAIIGLLFAVAAVLDEVLVAILLRFLIADPPAPDLVLLGLRGASSAAIGVASLRIFDTFQGRFTHWRKTRRRRVKMAP